MDNQKFFLIIAIFLSIFLLWDRWEATHTVDANGNIINQPIVANTINNNTTTTDQSVDVPSIVTNNTSPDLPVTETKSQDPYTTVVTDLLTIEINHKGGTIQNAWLNDYPVELNSEQKFQLLSNKSGEIFQAQSGLLPQGQMPTHHSMFSSSKSNYKMQGDSLTVPLTWRGNQGVVVTKNYHFKKGSYVVDIDYQVANTTNNALNITGYTQLARNALDQSNMMMPTYTGGAKFDDQEVFEKIEFDDFDSQLKSTSKGGWMAMIEHYFFAAWIP